MLDCLVKTLDLIVKYKLNEDQAVTAHKIVCSLINNKGE